MWIIADECGLVRASIAVERVRKATVSSFEEGADPEEVADEIRTRSDKEGVEAIIRDTLTVKIAADGRWAVEKKAGH